VERNQDFIYICFDNESYMNTGGQRSGTTPFGARTSTTPVGSVVKGEDRIPKLRKDMVEIMAAHNMPYIASASMGFPLDFMEKVKKASEVRGPSYIHCHTPCPTGWGFDPQNTIKVSKLAVQTGCVVLLEIENGVRRITKKISRFRHVVGDPEAMAGIQGIVDDSFESILAKVATQPRSGNSAGQNRGTCRY
jgi:pyruvate ferredoxin oxidoreductase beta subunit